MRIQRSPEPPPPAAERGLRVAGSPAEASAPASSPEEDDVALCQRVAGGDDDAFEVLVTRYQNRIYGFCLRMLHDRAEAEDVAQDVFLTLYRSAGDFRSESAFSTWLFRIAKNQTLNRIKYLDRRGRTSPKILADGGEARVAALMDAEERQPDALLEGGQRSALVQAAIHQLQDEHRAVLLLRDVEELSYEEISAATGLPLGTVKSRIHRGRSQLVSILSRFFR